MTTVELQSADAPPLLKLDRVSHSFIRGRNERFVLHDVSLTVHRGEMVALYGRSGSGKSTLLNISGGLDTPTRGTVVLGGRDLSRLSRDERTTHRRMTCAYVFQDYNLIRTLTALENVMLPLEFDGRRQSDVRRDALAALRAVEMEGHADSFPDELSGGEQQRVAIARALTRKDDLLLVDEPTGALDSATGAAILGLLRASVAQLGACVVATHDPMVAEVADRVLQLCDGSLTKVVTPGRTRLG